MLKVIGCFASYHDFRLVALAAALCALAAYASIELLRHAQQTARRSRAVWIGVAAFAGGSGIWATHFVAMLAFSPGLPSGYDLTLTVLSLLLAIAMAWVGFTVAFWSKTSTAPAIGGMVVGVGIGAMHYTGMAAFQIAGRVRWDGTLVVASLIIGAVLGGAALQVALNGKSVTRRVGGRLLLVLAICGLHFTGMGAVTIVPDPTIDVAPSAVPASVIAIAVTLASIAFLCLVNAALMLDVRRRASIESHLRSLADAAVEGLVICKDRVIVAANKSFGDLIGIDARTLTGASVLDYMPSEATECLSSKRLESAVEANLRDPLGESIPVELIIRSIAYADTPHTAIAVRDLRARRRDEAQILFLTNHDALTGLLNRAAFNDRLRQGICLAQVGGRKLAVLYIDIDRFKETNDVFGHAAGDGVLVNVARRLASMLEQTLEMGRLGGDEFAVLASVVDADEAGRLAERILRAVRVGAAEATGPSVTASIGIAIYPDDDLDPAALISQADAALDGAKGAGGDTYIFHDARMREEARDRRRLEHDLQHAISRDEMHLVYQPQSDIVTGAVTGFEVLLRWRHADRGNVSPAEFIPIAEESGHILQIGEWVMRQACQEAARWPTKLSIAVNVSAVQIHSPALVQMIHQLLLDTGLSPDRLEIEVTETALVRDPVRALTILRQIKALGVSLAMDDFGTGYSSLSNLRTFPFDRIKIDRSFVRSVDTNPQAAAIIRAVVGLGHGLDMPVVAEGVETESELRFLKTHRCHAAQGFLLGRPSEIACYSDHTHGGGYRRPVALSA